MTFKKFFVGGLVAISVVSGFAVSGIPESSNWWEMTKPFFLVWIISTALAVIIPNFNQIRRIIYPAFVCISAWLYKYKIIMTKFTRDTYRVYKYNSKSFKKLFGYTQDLFDAMYMS